MTVLEYPCELAGHDELVLVSGTVEPHEEGGLVARVEEVLVWSQWRYVLWEPDEEESKALEESLERVWWERSSKEAA